MRILITGILLFVFGLSNLIFAQDYKVNWGPTYKKDGGMFARFYLVGGDKDNYYLLMRPKKNNTLLQYNYDHKLMKTTEVSFTHGKEYLNPQEFIETKSGTYAYMPYFDKKAKEYIIYTSKFENGKFGSLEKSYSQQFKVEYKFFYYGIAMVLNGYTDNDNKGYQISENREYVAFASSFSSKDKKKADEMGIVVLNDKMEKVWEKKQDFPYKDNDVDIQQVIVSNSGVVYFSARVWKERGEREKGVPNYDFKVFRITKDDMKEYNIDLGSDKAAQESGLFISKAEDEVFLGGFFTNKQKNSGVNGTFVTKVNIKSGESTNKINDFDAAFLEGLIKEKQIKKGKGVSESFDIDHLITFADGTFSFIAEKYYITVHYTYSNGQTRTYYVYHSDEIIIPRFDKEGTLLSTNKIDKIYSSTSPYTTSYTYAAHNGKIYLMYNDRKTREERKESDVAGGKNSRFTDLTVLDNTGNIEYQKTLFSNKEIETEFVPSYSMQIGDKLILGGLRGKGYQFGTLNLK
ncbi:MAG: hypothetical protein R2836_03085 [Chitinophagales bacterium]|nr:hypothetical protein [Bacteroidota bacterium]